MAVTINPSTYKQVQENTENIQPVYEALEGFDKTGGTLPEQLASITTLQQTQQTALNAIMAAKTVRSEADTYGTIPDLKVIGITLETANITLATLPSAYTREITYELKTSTALGLDGREGITGNLFLVVTYKLAHTVEGAIDSIKPFQTVFTGTISRLYREKNTDTDTWSAWIENTSDDHPTGFVTSDTQPIADAQNTGDFWDKPMGTFTMGV